LQNFRKNEEDLQWVAAETWSFHCTFDVAERVGHESMATRELVLEGVDTVALVALNGKHIADLQNAHR
jgi:beta-mannosidase